MFGFRSCQAVAERRAASVSAPVAAAPPSAPDAAFSPATSRKLAAAAARRAARLEERMARAASLGVDRVIAAHERTRCVYTFEHKSALLLISIVAVTSSDFNLQLRMCMII